MMLGDLYLGPMGYRYPESQGKLIKRVGDPIRQLDGDQYSFESWYTDHLQRHEPDRYEKCKELIGTGDQGWARNLRAASDAMVIRFAELFFGKDQTPLVLPDQAPTHVEIHYGFNVSTGYDVLRVSAAFLRDSS